MKHLLNEEQKERGGAGFTAELKDGVISIYHCENRMLLRQWEGSGEDWDAIWDLFKLLEDNANGHKPRIETDSESIEEEDSFERDWCGFCQMSCVADNENNCPHCGGKVNEN